MIDFSASTSQREALDPFAAHIEISHEALQCNIRTLRGLLGPSRRLAAVLKGNAYGHGRDLIADLIANDVDLLAVAEPADALALAARAPGRVLCMGPAHGEVMRECVARGVRVAVSSSRQLEYLTPDAVVHLLVDTGMHRLGVAPHNAPALAQAIRARGARLEAAFCMVVRGDYDEWESVAAEVALLRGLDLGVEEVHTGGSSVTLDRPGLAGEIGRVGSALYGHYPPPAVRAHVALEPCLRLFAPVLELRRVPTGDGVGYDPRPLPRETLVATLPLGTAHGLNPGLDERFGAVLDGTYCRFLCPPMFDYSLLDATDARNVEIGLEALVIGGPPGSRTFVEDVARELGIHADHVVAALVPSIRRVVAD
jgi:alanine racemase